MAYFGNSVLLKSQRSHLDILSYLVGYIIIKAGRVVPLGDYGFTSGKSKKGGSTLVNV